MLVDLSFELGQPLSVLRDMSADDLAVYRRYIAHKGLPSRRVELLLAQSAMMIAQTMGGAKNVKLSDFLFDPVPDAPEQEQELTVEEIRAMHGFNPVKKRKPQ